MKKLTYKTFQAGWYGGDTASIVGECSCEEGFRWNEGALNWDLVFRPAVIPRSQGPNPQVMEVLLLGVMIGIVQKNSLENAVVF